MAALAKEREYSETLIIEGDQSAVQFFLNELTRAGLKHSFGGRFYEVSSGNDKGQAVKILTELYKLNFREVLTIGIGDSENDESMLNAVNRPILVQNHSKKWVKLKVPRVTLVRGIGPEGWNRALSSEEILALPAEQ
jgi:mannosyl-3-phosphoglycerate synthase